MAKQKIAPNPNVAINLKFLMSERPELGSQPLLAARSGVGQTTIGRILRGEVNATSENLKKICDAFDCEVNFIYWPVDRFKKAFYERSAQGLPLRLPVGEFQIRSQPILVKEGPPRYKIENPRHAALISLFESLPKSEQNDLIKSLEEKKQHYDELLAELSQRKLGE